MKFLKDLFKVKIKIKDPVKSDPETLKSKINYKEKLIRETTIKEINKRDKEFRRQREEKRIEKADRQREVKGSNLAETIVAVSVLSNPDSGSGSGGDCGGSD